MAKNVIINGVTYNNVPYVEIPLSAGSGVAKFVDSDSGDAVAADIKAGKKVWVDGEEITGTAASRSGSDISISGDQVTVPAGIYDSPISATVPTEQKTATPSDSSQEITPSSGKLLSKVTVNPVSLNGNATEADVLNGKTFYSNNLTKKTGTATVPTVSQDQQTKVLSIA